MSVNSRQASCIVSSRREVQYIPRNMHTFYALLCFVVVIHWLIFPYPSGLLHWHCGNLTIAPVPAKQPWWIWINTSCELVMNDCITTKPCAYFLGYTVPTESTHWGGMIHASVNWVILTFDRYSRLSSSKPLFESMRTCCLFITVTS